ncbi:hypothetical protein [Mycobacterium ostraviense]|nr:hypothetical protein [Mycobacterium ostraviense]UGT93834.1 hypothetical protein LTS72_11790 [Mycobacterium ostraviense]
MSSLHRLPRSAAHTLDEQTALSYTAQVPIPLLAEQYLTGIPDQVIGQA